MVHKLTLSEIQAAYRQGFLDGAEAFAWWKDGQQFCGTSSATPLRKVIDSTPSIHGYDADFAADRFGGESQSGNRPAGQSCEFCRFFAEVVDKPKRESTGECVLNPVPVAPIRRTYWCGKFESVLKW